MAYCAYCGSHVDQVSYAPCASCGKPSNGAPVRAAGGGGGANVAVIVAVVIAGVLVIVAIIGIMAAIAIPNLLTATHRSKQKRTMADMRMLGTAIEAYVADKRVFPPGHSISEVAPHLTPTYIRNLPTTDGWGTELAYETLPNGGYIIASGGGDQSFEAGSLLDYTRATTQHFDCDIVYSNGEFVQAPEGAQTH